MNSQKFVIITVSDTCSSGKNKDTSGPFLVDSLKASFINAEVESLIIPDEVVVIANSLKYYSDIFQANLIITTGGTGFANRDVTPEATQKVIDKEANGISTALLMQSLQITPMAALSRLKSGIRKSTLIINFPGSLKAVRECYNVVKVILPHALALLNENKDNVKKTHDELQNEPSVSKGCCHHKKESSSGGRVRHSPYPMIEVSQAMDLIIDTLKNDSVQRTLDLEMLDCLGYTAAEDIKAKEPFPPFEASIKDGYACFAEDGKGRRTVCGDIAAGDDPSQQLKRGECVFINTGAPIPKNANCVVQIEDTNVLEESDGIEKTIDILSEPKVGQDIRKIGSDIEKDEIIIHKGTYIGPVEMGLLATAGVLKMKVFSKPCVGILSTGNELQEYSTDELKAGHIRDSNKIMLQTLFRKHNFESKDFGIIRDDPKIVMESLRNIFQNTDVLITTGSVSMGDKDLLKPILQKEFQAEIVFGRLNMRPGKPTTFATCVFENKKKYIFALPGNPVSAYVTCNLLVIPSLNYWSGKDDYKLTRINVQLNVDVQLDPRPHYARATMQFSPTSSCPLATLTGNQISSRLMNSSGANIFIELPGSGKSSHLPKGTIVSALLIN